MEKETLTVETDEDGTVTYRNASGQLHNPYGPAMVGLDGSKYHYINGKLHNPNGLRLFARMQSVLRQRQDTQSIRACDCLRGWQQGVLH
jgi:hypothetical protein